MRISFGLLGILAHSGNDYSQSEAQEMYHLWHTETQLGMQMECYYHANGDFFALTPASRAPRTYTLPGMPAMQLGGDVIILEDDGSID